MNRSWYILLGLAALGIHGGLAAAARGATLAEVWVTCSWGPVAAQPDTETASAARAAQIVFLARGMCSTLTRSDDHLVRFIRR